MKVSCSVSASPQPGSSSSGRSSRVVVPLSERRIDLAILGFFWFNVLFVSYSISLEQLVVPNPESFEYPLWPPRFLIDLVHWWGRTFDPVLWARPMWYRMTIWLDVLAFGPFYVVAIYAFTKGREWIRIPSIVYASVLFTNVFIILGEELAGPHAAESFLPIFLANAPWLLIPILIVFRMGRSEHPFTSPVGSDAR